MHKVDEPDSYPAQQTASCQIHNAREFEINHGLGQAAIGLHRKIAAHFRVRCGQIQ